MCSLTIECVLQQVVAIAVQHLRLLLARWRQPLLRERFRIQLQAASQVFTTRESILYYWRTHCILESPQCMQLQAASQVFTTIEHISYC